MTGAYPVNYVLSHIVNNPERPHGGMNISSDLFPYHFEDSKPPEGWEGPYGCTYTESKQCESLPPPLAPTSPSRLARFNPMRSTTAGSYLASVWPQRSSGRSVPTA